MASRPSVMEHKFSQVPKAEIPRSSFDRSHGMKTTFNAGYLVPIYLDEALPGDTFNLKMTGFARMATPIKPIMDNLYMETFFFAVPNRLLWEHWQNFMGEKDTIDDTTEYLVPEMTLPEASETTGSIYDHVGLPIFANNSVKFNTLHLRAYNLIWNEWFRDQNLQNPVRVNLADSGDVPADFQLLRRGKRHDYFTSCLPWPQKGEDVLIPGTIEGGAIYDVISDASNQGLFTWQVPGQGITTVQAGSVAQDVQTSASYSPGNTFVWGDPALQVEIPTADLTPGDAGGWATINDLRVAFQLQKMLERDARGGTRYTEVIRAHFGVTSPDARLQRPEFLGGGSSRITIKPVEQNTQAVDPAQTPQGNLAAFGTANLINHGFVKSFTEHCTLIGLVNVRADLTYQQGLDRMWFRRRRYDFFWPVFANVSEQQVFDWEIYAEDETGDPDGVIFGYQERYAEYRYKPSKITGAFRSDSPASLDVWHLSQDFASSPSLNSEFIEDDPPVDRVIAVQTEPHFLFDSYFSLRCARPMPLFGVPGNIDRF